MFRVIHGLFKKFYSLHLIYKILLLFVIASILGSPICFAEIKQCEREYPKEYIKRAIELFKHRNGKIIVEIGSMRCPISHPVAKGHCGACMDGHSTMWWAITGAEVYSVDIADENIKLVQTTCKNYKKVHAIKHDGIEFLKSFKQPIDLLFLDAWDVKAGTLYAENHLEAYKAAKPNLHAKSLVLIDDTDVENCGKGRLVIPQAIKDGYKIVFSGRQTLLAKGL